MPECRNAGIPESRNPRNNYKNYELKNKLIKLNYIHDSSKCWHLGRARDYYHATMTCIKYRNPGFKTELHLTGVAGRLEGGLVLTNELWRELWERFGQAIFY